MPGPSLEDELFGDAPPPASAPLEDELFADVAQMDAAPEDVAVADAQNRVAAGIGQEQQPVGQFKERSIGDEPWYTKLADTFSPRADETANPGAVAVENVASGALANTADEIGSAAMQSPEMLGVDDNQGYQGISAQTADDTNDYAAGSRFEDNRRTLEQEKAERDAQHPVFAAGGQVLGAGLQTAALPAAAATSIPGAAATGAGLTAAHYMGSGSGGLDERAKQAVDMAEQHPIATTASVLLPAAAAGLGQLAGVGAKGLDDASALNRTAAIMTPGQRATYAASKGGKQGLIRLGKNIEGAGLHQRAPDGPWFKNLLPASTENMYDNSLALKADAGKRLNAAEDTIGAVNPDVETGPIVQDLRGRATDVLKRSDEEAARAQAGFLEKQAAGLEKNQTRLPGTPGPAPVKPVARPPEGPWTPEKPAVYATPSPEEIAAYEAKLVPPEVPQQQPKEGPWTPEVPERKVPPEEWAKYLENVKTLPEGAALPPAPIDRPYVPSRGPGVVEPGAADFREYHKALAAHQNPGPAPAPKLIEPEVASAPPGPSVVTPREWHDYLLAEEQFKNPASVPSGKSDFNTTVADRRFIDDQTNFTPSGGIENAGMKDQVRRQLGTALRQKIGEGLDTAATEKPELVKPVADWRKANRDFSLASTVEDPALMNMQKEYGGSLGLRDMATATAAQAMGIPGPMAVAAGKFAKGGRGANALAGTQKNMSKVLGEYSTDAGPSTLATTQAAVPDPKVQKAKNEDMKSQLSEAMSHGWDWFKSFVD